MTSPVREAHWVLAAQSGDREALGKLLTALEEPLSRYVLHVVRRAELADDILQEVFLRICKSLEFLREPELFRAWAYRIATREAVRALKKERAWSERVDPEVAPEDTAASDPERLDPDVLQRLLAMLEALSPSSRAVIHLHYFDEMSIYEVAEVLDVPPGTVKSRLAYGLAALRRTIASPSKVGGNE